MTARALLDSGDLSAAVAEATRDLKTDPGDAGKRTFLFELLLFAGDLDRAEKQLDILAAPDVKAAARYRYVLEGERRRRMVMAGEREPGLPGKAPEYARLHLEALRRMAAGEAAQAYELLARAAEMRGPNPFRVEDEQAADLRDADDLLAPFLEVITPGNYAWVPWEMIASIEIPPPEHLADLCYMPAGIELTFGPLGEAYVPVLYPGSHAHPDAGVKLGRTTEWRDEHGVARGAGQRLLTDGDQRDWPILEIRRAEACRAEAGTDGGD